MKSTRNFARHPLGLIMVLVNFISVATFVLEPVAHAQVTGDWIPTGSLNTPRVGHTATLLPNGKVLVAAGYNGTDFLSSAELYDPASGTWSITGSLNAPRYYPTATLLTNGKVLVVGGDNSGGGAELYDPSTGTWSVTGNLLVARSDHAATLLPNGKVLIAGGVIGYTDFDLPITVNNAELYDPATETWSIAANLNTARGGHTVTLLQNGKVLVAGGWDGLSYGPSAELYDPVTGIWSYTGNLNISHYGDTATLLANGQVLVVGGFSTNYAELYDPATATWRFTDAPNSGGAATLLPNGKVLLVAESGAKLYDPATGTWSVTANPNPPHHLGTATLLPSGKVLVAGGLSRNTTCCIPFNVLNSAELYDPTAEGVLNSSTFVRQQYLDFLDRDPEAAGLAGWVNALDGGLPRASLIGAFMDSEEFFSKGKFIAQTYLGLLTRDADYSGYRAWLEVLLAGVSHEQIVQWFLDSDEFTIRFGSSLTNSQFIERMYNNVLLRSADPGGSNFWVGQLTSGQMTRAQVALGFLDSDEFQNLSTSQSEIDVSLLYFSMLRRDPDPGGFAGWVGALNSGVPLNWVIDGFLNSPEYQAGF